MTKRCADHSAQRFFKVLGAIQALFATATTRFAYPDMSSMSEYMVGKMTSVIFTCEVPLERGATEIQIQATDRAGNATASTITVHRVSE